MSSNGDSFSNVLSSFPGRVPVLFFQTAPEIYTPIRNGLVTIGNEGSSEKYRGTVANRKDRDLGALLTG